MRWIAHSLSARSPHPPCRFCDLHSFEKPNDLRALHLMDEAAVVRRRRWQSRRPLPTSYYTLSLPLNTPIGSAGKLTDTDLPNCGGGPSL